MKKSGHFITDCFYLTHHIKDDDQFYFGLRKISEIAVKALSPGINDPGTALKSIRLLILLFADVVKMKDHIYYTNSSNEIRIISKLPGLNNLLYMCITPIRQYSGGSLEIILALFDFFYATFMAAGQNAVAILKHHLDSLVISAQNEIENSKDNEQIKLKIEEIEKYLSSPD